MPEEPMTKEEQEAYEAYQDRVSESGRPRKLTEEEIEELRKEERI